MTVVINGTTGYSGPVGVLGDLTTTGNTILGDQSTDTLNVANGNLVLNSSGNLGIGVTPSAWSQGKALEIGAVGEGLWGNSLGDLWMVNGAYYNSGWKYSGSTKVTAYRQGGGTTDGSHSWAVAPLGTAGNAITFTQAMTLDASGRLLLGTTSGTQRFTVNSGMDVTDGTITTRLAQSNGAALIGTTTGHSFFFMTNDTERMRLDTSGNLGLGVTPAAWNSVYRSMQLGKGASISGRSDSNSWLELMSNAYRASDASWKYLNTDFALTLRISDGSYQFYTAPSGTAGNAITFTQAMTLDNSGRLVTPSQPAFRASFNISPPTAYVSGGRYLNFTSVATNIGSCYDGTNKFTAPVAGRYIFSVNRSLNTYGTGKTIRHPSMYFYKNGVAVYEMNTAVASGTDVGATDYTHFGVAMTAILELAANDYIQVYFTYDNSPAVLYEYGSSYFQGYLLG
jgi:hypothetical protein